MIALVLTMLCLAGIGLQVGPYQVLFHKNAISQLGLTQAEAKQITETSPSERPDPNLTFETVDATLAMIESQIKPSRRRRYRQLVAQHYIFNDVEYEYAMHLLGRPLTEEQVGHLAEIWPKSMAEVQKVHLVDQDTKMADILRQRIEDEDFAKRYGEYLYVPNANRNYRTDEGLGRIRRSHAVRMIMSETVRKELGLKRNDGVADRHADIILSLRRSRGVDRQTALDMHILVEDAIASGIPTRKQDRYKQLLFQTLVHSRHFHRAMHWGTVNPASEQMQKEAEEYIRARAAHRGLQRWNAALSCLETAVPREELEELLGEPIEWDIETKSIGQFRESGWTKLLPKEGNPRRKGDRR